MVRATFIKKLKAIGEIPVPKGHLARNKGISSYFFAPDKEETIKTLLKELIGQPIPAPMYEEGTQWYKGFSQKDPEPTRWLDRSILFHPPTTGKLRPEDHQEPFITVAVCFWIS